MPKFRIYCALLISAAAPVVSAVSGSGSMDACASPPRGRPAVAPAMRRRPLLWHRSVSVRSPTPSVPRVALIDDFETPRVQLAGGTRPVPHGRVTEILLRHHGPHMAVERFQANGNKRSLAQALRLARRQATKNSQFDAVVVCASSDEALKKLADLFAKGLTRRNLATHAESLRRRTAEDKELSAVFRAAEAFSRPGLFRRACPVFFPAGNAGPDRGNLYSLTRGAVTVGAVDFAEEKCPESGDNALVSRWAQGISLVRRVRQGYNLTGGPEAQILEAEVVMPGISDVPKGGVAGCIGGTSVACAVAAGAGLHKRPR